MFQFIHVNSYSRTLSKKAKHAKRTAQDVINEAVRDPDSIPHIDEPKPHIHVYGEPIENLEKTLDDWAENTKDARGRKTRKDAVCLLAGVFSVPDGTPPEDWEKVKKDFIKWAEKKYGKCLKTIIEHTDEAHPHCHFYVVAEHGKSFESVHEGRAAVKDFVAAGGDKMKTNDVYREAMREYQNEYFEEVGAKNGMTRIGPGKRRLSREAWRMEQQQAEAFKAAHDKLEALESEQTKAFEAKEEKIAVSEAKSIEMLEKARIEQKLIADQAKADAEKTAEEALKNADEMRRQGQQDGFQQGLDRVGALPWIKRLKTILGRSDSKLEKLEKEVEKLKKESQTKTGKSWKDIARKYSKIGKNLTERLEEAETALILERQKAAKAEDLERENSKLAKALASAEHEVSLAKQWEEIRAEKAPEEPAPRQKSRHERDSGMEL